jgi:hypothetical protein
MCRTMQASRNSFTVLKERLRPAASEQQSSFFDVEVNLKVPCVVVSPSLDEIQEAVNTCAKKVAHLPNSSSVMKNLASCIFPAKLPYFCQQGFCLYT